MNSSKDSLIVLVLGVLYSYVGSNILYGFFALPLYFQIRYLREKFEGSGKLVKKLTQIYSITFVFSFLLYLMSSKFHFQDWFYFVGTSDVGRGVSAILLGLAFAIMLTLTQELHLKIRKRA